jgi:hypothetical protein
MKNKFIFSTLSLAVILGVMPFLLPANGFAQNASPRNAAIALTPDRLERLVAPVALYPDPVLAQILPATTAPDDIQRANAFLRSNNYRPTAAINNQPWNLSVRSLSYYPPVINGLANNQNWTTLVGQAFVTQERDILDAIQRLRGRAYRNGSLRSSSRQRVVINGNTIVIYSTQPNSLYLPQYNPDLFWSTTVTQPGSPISITYSNALPVGPWLNLDLNWDSGEVYYHGWNTNVGGWVSYYRPNVTVNGGGVYVNNGYDDSYFVNNNVIYRPSPPFGGGVTYPSFPVIVNQPWRPGADTLNRPTGVPHPAVGSVPHPGGFKP